MTVESNWSIDDSTLLYEISDSSLSNNAVDEYSTNFANYTTSASAGTVTPGGNSGSTTRTQAQWNTLLKFGTSTTQGVWFIDKASFAGRQNSDSSGDTISQSG